MGRQQHVERFVDGRDGRVAGHALAAVGQGVDARLAVFLVELVFDLADDLLHHVFEGHEAGGMPELVDHDRDVVAIGAEVAQQVIERLRLRHVERGAQQRAQVQVGRALQLEQVFGHQDADDVFLALLVDRKARVASAYDDVQQIFVVGVDVELVHVLARHHHVAGRHVGHADDALEHHPRLGLDQLLVLGIGQRFDQLVFRVRPWRDQVDELFQQAAPILRRCALLGSARSAGGGGL